MTTVTFEIHQVRGSAIDELGEDELARRLDAGGAPANALVEMDPLEGAIVIADGVARGVILDELESAVARLCFDAVAHLSAQDATPYLYPYFTASMRAELVPAAARIEVRGEDIPATHHDARELLVALYGCGMRYLTWLERLGQRDAPATLAFLRPYADRARAALAR